MYFSRKTSAYMDSFRLAKSFTLAQNIQQNIINTKSLPAVADWIIHAYNRQAEIIGGDFFKIHKLPPVPTAVYLRTPVERTQYGYLIKTGGKTSAPLSELQIKRYLLKKYGAAEHITETINHINQFISRFHERIAIILCDCTGTMIDGAMYTGIINEICDRHFNLLQQLNATALFMTMVSTTFSKRITNNQFPEFSTCILDTETNAFYSSYMSLCPPLALAKNGIRELGHTSGTLLGLSEAMTALGHYKNLEYVQNQETILPGEKIIFYTDGITDIARQHRHWDLEKTKAFLQSLPPGLSGDQIITAVKTHSIIRTSTDDITIIILEPKPGTPGIPTTTTFETKFALIPSLAKRIFSFFVSRSMR